MLTLILGIASLFVALVLGFFLGQRSSRTLQSAAQAELARLNAALQSAVNDRSVAEAASAAAGAFAEERLRMLEAAKTEREGLQTELTRIQGEKAETEKQLTGEIHGLREALDSERSRTAENLQLLQNAQQALTAQFQALAGQVLDARAKSYSESSRKEIADLLGPLREQLDGFRKKVEESQLDSAKSVSGLRELIGTLTGMNQELADKTTALTQALSGSAKTQGDWGEFILLDLLEKAGLRQGQQFTFQQSFAAADTATGEPSRTDVILHLPGSRQLVVDSKVSLTAWTEYTSATEESTRTEALKRHQASVRSHIKGLAGKQYHNLNGLATPDFVVLFIPIEPAALTALQSDADLWQDAYRSNILIAGPTTLLFVIRIVDNLWQQEQQARNVREIADRGARLYEKFVGFVEDMQKLDDRLRQARTSFDSAMGKLSSGAGNLIGQVEKLKQLGVKPSKTLPQPLVARALDEEADAGSVSQLSLAASDDSAQNTPS